VVVLDRCAKSLSEDDFDESFDAASQSGQESNRG
jgi:hypothetical protein